MAGPRFCVVVDVSQAADCERMIAQTERVFGKLDVLFNNAGVMLSDDGDSQQTTEEVWHDTLDINASACPNSGRYDATWSVGGPNVGHGVSSGVQTEWLANPGGVGGFFRQPLGSAHTDISNDDPAITYFSPRFNGFQFTATHRPTVQGGGSGGQNIGFANEMEDYTNAVDGSVQYQGDVGGVGVTLMAGVASASASDGPGMCGEDDYQAVNGGIRISAMGFSAGGILSDVDDEQRCGSGTAMHVGASYGQGPWAISVTAHDGDMEQSPAAGESELSVWAVGARYTLGGGVTLHASFQDAEISNEAGDSNAGNAFTAGIRVGF